MINRYDTMHVDLPMRSPTVFSSVRVARSFLCVVSVDDCLSLCALFFFDILLSFLRHTAYDYLFGIFKLFSP